AQTVPHSRYAVDQQNFRCIRRLGSLRYILGKENMKKACTMLWLLLLVLPLNAQNRPPSPPDGMKKLDYLVGEWKGEGWIAFGGGERRTFTQSETIQPKLGGMLLQIEGLGK